MRPRVFPAEDDVVGMWNGTIIHASMRPRVFPAEDARGCRSRRRASVASMRPRVFPAEDVGASGDARSSFNEAAGIPRGRPSGGGRGCFGASMRPRVFPAEDRFCYSACYSAGYCYSASMRPRVFPAEDGRTGSPSSRTTPRFNEAAGIPRGRLSTRWSSAAGCGAGFNEAAGIPRGRRPSTGTRAFSSASASMRPRVFPAEDAIRVAPRAGRHRASMRPRGRGYSPRKTLDTLCIRTGRPLRPLRASMRPRVFPAEDDDLRGRCSALQ